MDPIQELESLLKICGKAMGYEIVDCQDLLKRSETKKNTLINKIVPQEKSKTSGTGDSSLKVLKIGIHHAFLGMLDEAENAANLCEEFKRQIAISSTWLEYKFRSDINLYLVGPLGSEKNIKWEKVKSEIERDEITCRKLVWLPPADESNSQLSLLDFFNRTFLAQPWADLDHVATKELDPFLKIRTQSKVNEIWFKILEQTKVIDNSTIAELLIKHYE